MSSTMATDLNRSTSESLESTYSGSNEFDEFDYRPVSPWGPVALVLGIAALTAFTNSVFGIVIAVLGVIVGVLAIIRLRNPNSVFKGLGFAAAGSILSFLCLTLGSVKFVHAYQTECPEGFLRVSFPKEISDYQFVYFGDQRRLHPEVAPLIGQKVFLKGFMWEAKKLEGLTEFVFLKDNGECCFGGEPKPYDMMVVKMAEGETTRAFTGMIAVSGILNANVRAVDGEEPVYTVDAIRVEEAQTAF